MKRSRNKKRMAIKQAKQQKQVRNLKMAGQVYHERFKDQDAKDEVRNGPLLPPDQS